MIFSHVQSWYRVNISDWSLDESNTLYVHIVRESFCYRKKNLSWKGPCTVKEGGFHLNATLFFIILSYLLLEFLIWCSEGPSEILYQSGWWFHLLRSCGPGDYLTLYFFVPNIRHSQNVPSAVFLTRKVLSGTRKSVLFRMKEIPSSR